MSTNESIIKRGLEEIITEERLNSLLKKDGCLKAYIGVEPSGLFTIGWMIWARKFKDLVDSGVESILLQATWHAWINDKLGGSMENIRLCALYIEHCLEALGIPENSYQTVYADELVYSKDYWSLVLKIAKALTLNRVKRALTIMGRRSDEAAMDFSKLIYPCMQVADIFYLDLDLCLGGMDQRRAHVLAIETADKLNRKKPVALHTPILIGLAGLGRMEGNVKGEMLYEFKMSKSKPETALFIHDEEDEIEKKIMKAYCPARMVENNPVLEICRLILFPEPGFELKIERETCHGGDIEVKSYRELEDFYFKGELHPLDLKRAVSVALNERLKPVRKYFDHVTEAYELYSKLKNLTITR
ncbi:tyrosine--tRNA ligase [Candidatus Bathyarchaeota archaeon]|nr:tyrosine--tRNA ligase [Candidatus Bathyarchaeota archaeon]MBS7613647.1 tyrosine--tRNA ligase [Candidatus Bathyarchaeota archaeon]MBS7617591.1 tyrosine--tRNA ligase [Candidatus Bathyarchaeota archaeon]